MAEGGDRAARRLRILVFPCGTEVGLEIHRSFASSTHFQLIGASSVSDHGAFTYAEYVQGLPFVDDAEFVSAFRQVIEDKQADLVMPAHDDVVVIAAQLAAAGGLTATVIGSPLPTCEITRSKRATYAALEGFVPVPRIVDPYSEVGGDNLPVFLKPDRGQGSRGARRIDSSHDLAIWIAQDPTAIVTEFLPGPEYTVDCFTDRHGDLLYAGARTRSRVSGGISVRSAFDTRRQFQSLAKAINQRFRLRGAWFFQLKERLSGEMVLLEVAPRVAGTMGLTRARGVNLPLLSAFDSIGQDVRIEPNDYAVTVDRALNSSYHSDISFDAVYLDLDDLLVIDGKVNPAAIAFVFSCRNKSIPVHLITRHAGDLPATLDRYAIAGCFDEVIWLRSSEPKSSYIAHPRSIFIDDSFAERSEVRNRCGIPVFDGHMFEMLNGVVGEARTAGPLNTGGVHIDD